MRFNSGNTSVLALAAAVGVSAGAFAQPAQGMPAAKISWSMAERTIGIDNAATRQFHPELLVYPGLHRMLEGPDGAPGLYGGVSSVPLDQINPPDGYEVTLNGCASSGDIQQYEWHIDGTSVAKSNDCSFTTRLAEGDYSVQLTVNGGGPIGSATELITVRDLLFVVMGDSYTSGEGNALVYEADTPDSTLAEAQANNGKGWSEGSFWDYANCHRSTRSGQINALIDLEDADPHTSVTTLFLACSGAQIDSGIQGIKDGNLSILPEFSAPEKPQSYQAYELAILNGRDIDGALIGIGGNDIGFVPIVTEGLFQPDAFFSTEQSVLVPLDPLLPLRSETPVLAPSDIPPLLLAPDGDYVDPFDSPPGPPTRELAANSLHACDEQYQKAAWGEGDLGPLESCRQGIGTTEFGLADVNRCLTGTGPNDCVFARSYYIFPPEGESVENGYWKYPDGSSVGVPASWPGLGVDPVRVFYSEYPDLTTEFTGPPLSIQFCEIALSKDEMLTILRLLKVFADNPVLIDALVGIVEGLPEATEFGLAQNEFQWASESVLNAPLLPPLKAAFLELTSEWRVKSNLLPPAFFTIPTDVALPMDYPFETLRVSLGDDGPALNEMTARSGLPVAEGGYGWTPVIGGHDAATGHGLCNAQPTGDPLADLQSAFAYLIGPVQGTNASGSAHPNLLGMKYVYHYPNAAALLEAFGLIP